MKLPYGISNFKSLVEQGYYFRDRTPYIEHLEALGEKFIFFLRPRRFGKSLFVSMLAHYYDLNEKDNFQEIFGKYYIGQQPTPLANQYAVLELEFSRINTATPETTLKGFLSNTQQGIEKFIKKYGLISDTENQKILNQNEPAEILKAFLAAYQNQLKIYLLIDEYDHFANELLDFNLDHFKNIVSRNGFVRKFYETLKTGTYEGIIDRIFVTGVTSMTLDSLTSGFNIGANLTLEAELGHMLGFTEEEVKDMIAILNPEAPIEELIKDMRYFYNGYHFAGNPAERVYNPDMVLYFLKHYQRHQNYPEQILDVNIASDYGKIRRLFKLRNPEQNNEILQKIVSLGTISGNITAQFSFEKEFEEDDFLSLLFYMGYLTIQGEVVGLKKFVVPNYVIRKLFIEYFAFLLREQEQIPYKASEVKEALIEMAMQGNPEPFFQIIGKILRHLSDRDYRNFDEKYIKLLMIATALPGEAYLLHSEREQESGYTDLQFRERPPFHVNYQYIFEIKYLKKEDRSQLEKAQEKAKEQLIQYLQNDRELQSLHSLKAYTLVVMKDELFWREV